MRDKPDVKIVLPADGSMQGAKLFICGKEFPWLTSIKYGTEIVVDDIRSSKLELTFLGDVIVKSGNA